MHARDGIADLLVAWEWPYDEPFLTLLQATCAARALRLETVGPPELDAYLAALPPADAGPRAFLDRASDADPRFEPLAAWAGAHVPFCLNPTERQHYAWRKTHVHYDFLRAGYAVPHTLVLPAGAPAPPLPDAAALVPLGPVFTIKPDLGGGGRAVVLDARGPADVQRAREALPGEDLILQEFIEPMRLGADRAWFRVLYVCGTVLPCWWDDRTRLFSRLVSPLEAERFGLHALWPIAHAAAAIGGLALFSTEVACPRPGHFVVVDYINDPIDLRFAPHAADGLPADVAVAVAAALCDGLAGAR